MTESVSGEFFEIVELHDREFQKFSIDNEIYCVPVDTEEEERLESQHQILRYLFDNRLFFPPIQYPTKVLDCGFGRGNWALDMAQMYPDSEVTGIDVYPTNELPDDQPDNLEIEAWDLNQPLTPTYKPNEYDLIHSRLVAPGIKRDRWRGYIRDIVRLLKRGGWVQMAEFYYIIQSDSGMLTDDHALMQWSNGYRYTMERDRDPREVTYRMPIGGWSTDPKLQWVGQQNLDNIGTMLDSLAIWPFTERMGWSKEQVAALTQRARAEAADLRLKLYIPL
ncbi:Methyltransferase type 11 [Neofusicoccum parvum]|uniref:Methyltransferase type 11 n=2 Tax=Neofusicoccum parvum TaxID=310453 RepID=A0ACB5SBS5_9PEZI|nr:putative methyltransferase type 11 protein [Neofusicoccum parvum UCRNP2]GME34158.1 Methyltransferase type 11 [Neofusicoccum parvum]GME65994.1 Methyltransferase type 11 [Neofusicoccum parvum]